MSTEVRPQLIAGYSAPEQYAFGQENRPHAPTFTDWRRPIFRTLTGNPAARRLPPGQGFQRSFCSQQCGGGTPDYVAAALFNALQADPEKRTHTMEQLRDQLSTAPAVSAMREDDRRQTEAAASAASAAVEEPEEDDCGRDAEEEQPY